MSSIAMPMLDILVSARSLLTPEENWAKGDFAFSRYGFPIEPTNPNAQSWSLIGACTKVVGERGSQRDRDLTLHVVERYLMDTARRINVHTLYGIADYNDEDETSHADIIDFLDYAIEGLLDAQENVLPSTSADTNILETQT